MDVTPSLPVQEIKNSRGEHKETLREQIAEGIKLIQKGLFLFPCDHQSAAAGYGSNSVSDNGKVGRILRVFLAGRGI